MQQHRCNDGYVEILQSHAEIRFIWQINCGFVHIYVIKSSLSVCLSGGTPVFAFNVYLNVTVKVKYHRKSYRDVELVWEYFSDKAVSVFL